MGNEACTADTSQVAKDERNILTWSHSGTAQSQHGFPVENPLRGFAIGNGGDQFSHPPTHTGVDIASEVQPLTDGSWRTTDISGRQLSHGSSAPITVEDDDYPTASQNASTRIALGSTLREAGADRGVRFGGEERHSVADIERGGGFDEVDATANTHSKGHCYFDLEVGEAGPASSDPGTREHRWFRFRSGATYEGEWLGGMRDGKGKQSWPDGTSYVGEWRRGRAGGRGEIRHIDGDTFTGEWVNGRAHGSGVFRHHGSHAIYEGEFHNDMREGKGVELWVDGSWYAGEFHKGAKHGCGEHRWPNPTGTYYVGCWNGNELSGPGRYYVKDGPSYQGQWTSSVIDGSGVYTWTDGQQYEGEYKMDRKHGFGILTTPDGESSEAFWDKGVEVKIS